MDKLKDFFKLKKGGRVKDKGREQSKPSIWEQAGRRRKKKECPKCSGKGCSHCGGKGYHK